MKRTQQKSQISVSSYLLKKSLWQDRAPRSFAYFCSSCKSPRKLPAHPQPQRIHYFQVGVTTAFLMALLWPWFGIKGIVIFLPLWLGFESFYRTRVRAAAACDQCGFDPYLYAQDVDLAKREMQAHWRRKFAEKGIPYPGDPVVAPTPPTTDEAPAEGDSQISQEGSSMNSEASPPTP